MKEVLAESAPILLAFACVVVYQYIKDLRRSLQAARKSARTGWRMYDLTAIQLANAQGKPAPAPYFPEDREPEGRTETPESQGFRPRAIGHTAIMDRELRRERTAKERAEPRFAHPGVLTSQPPPGERIAAAARAAVRDADEDLPH